MWFVMVVGLACGSLDRKGVGDRRPDPEPGEESEGTEIPDDSTPVDDTGIVDPVGDGVACYLGEARDDRTCLDVVEVESLPPAYDYPAPLSGSSQYYEPVRYLDLDVVDESTRLAPNFVLEELAQAYKGRFGVVQTHAVAHLQSMRDDLGALVINSGYRSPDYNAGVGGATWSRHMYGDAFDIDPVSASLAELAESCEENGAGWVGVYTTHVHCDWRDDPLDPAFFPVARSALRWSEVPVLSAEIVRDGDLLTAPAWGWDEGEPLREWVAFDEAGATVATGEGSSLVWPAGATTVEVTIGRALVVRYSD